MTLSEHISKMKERIRELENVDKPVFFASNTALAELSERVFQKGQSVSGSTFQYNSTDPLYVNPKKTFGDTSGIRPPTGKPYGGKKGRTVFASTGLPHKTTWVESYKALRGLVGREDSFVNWVANGDLKSDIENRGTLTTKKVMDAQYKISVSDSENTDKLEGLNTKYPNVFKLSESEKKTYFRTFDIEYKRLIFNLFNK